MTIIYIKNESRGQLVCPLCSVSMTKMIIRNMKKSCFWLTFVKRVIEYLSLIDLEVINHCFKMTLGLSIYCLTVFWSVFCWEFKEKHDKVPDQHFFCHVTLTNIKLESRGHPISPLCSVFMTTCSPLAFKKMEQKTIFFVNEVCFKCN